MAFIGLPAGTYKPKPVKPKLTERQRFERWAKRQLLYVEPWGARYSHSVTDAAWSAWQASARAKR